MRALEIALPLLLAVALSTWLAPRRLRPAALPSIRLALTFAAALVFQLHALLEGTRWQLVPSYLIGMFLLLICGAQVYLTRIAGRDAGPADDAGWLGALASIVALMALGVSVGLSALMPVATLPAPSGPHAVGVVRLRLEDPARPEPFTASPDDRRVIGVELWYPAQPAADSSPRPYTDGRSATSRLQAEAVPLLLGVQLPEFWTRHFALITTHSHPAAPISDAAPRYPVVIFSHGFGIATNLDNTLLLEELASHGYVVASIGHSYESAFVLLDDDELIAFDETAIRSLGREFRAAAQALEKAVDSQDPEERRQALQRFTQSQTRAAQSLEIWSADTGFTIDALERIDAGQADPAFLAGRLDLGRIGVAGMSFGGATAGWFCAEDPRCRAALNLDGFQFGDWAGRTLDRPILIVQSDSTELRINEHLLPHLGDDAWRARIRGSRHLDFSDSTVLLPIARLGVGVLGPIDGTRMQNIMNAYVRTFFDATLRGGDARELSTLGYDEVEIERVSRGARSSL
jgi:predicted dienelactone hydrolase